MGVERGVCVVFVNWFQRSTVKGGRPQEQQEGDTCCGRQCEDIRPCLFEAGSMNDERECAWEGGRRESRREDNGKGCGSQLYSTRNWPWWLFITGARQ